MYLVVRKRYIYVEWRRRQPLSMNRQALIERKSAINIMFRSLRSRCANIHAGVDFTMGHSTK